MKPLLQAEQQRNPLGFCLGTEVPRHSAGCVGTYVRTWYVRTSLFAMRPRKCCMLYTLNRVSNVFIACKYIFKNDYGFAWLLMNPLIKTAATSYIQDNEYSFIQCMCCTQPSQVHTESDCFVYLCMCGCQFVCGTEMSSLSELEMLAVFSSHK